MKLLQISMVLLQADEDSRRGYLVPMDFLLLVAMVVVAVGLGWGLYRGMLPGWVNKLRHPFHLRTLTVIAGAGLWMVLWFFYLFGLIFRVWDWNTFITILISLIVVWFLLLIVDVWYGRRVSA